MIIKMVRTKENLGKKKYVSNDGVVDVPKTRDPIFKLDNVILATKQKEHKRPMIPTSLRLHNYLGLCVLSLIWLITLR